MPAKLTPLFAERALLVEHEGQRTLVAGDLHLGLETELRRKGIHGLDESTALVAHLGALATRERADRILLLGDVKHSLGAREAEARALAPLAHLPVRAEVVPGNHDGGLDEIAPFLRVLPMSGVVIGDVGLVHGHAWPAPAVLAGGRVVLCHNHPHVALADELGNVQTEPVWVRAPLSEETRKRFPDARLPGEAIIVPAFNPLLGGVALNRPGERPLGPLLTNRVIDLPRGRMVTVDGVDLGTIERLAEAFRGV